MRNFKKLIAVALTFVMLLGVMAIGVSANDAVAKISLVGMTKTGATASNTYYEVDVKVDDSTNAVGGIEGVINYDSDVLTYAGVELNKTFEASNNTVENSINAATAGTIKFVGLATGNGVWFTLRFTVADNKVGETTISIDDDKLKGANVSGTGYVNVAVQNLTVSVVNDDIVKVGGAAIRTVDNADAQDIMFHSIVDAAELKKEYGEDVQVKEIGALMGIKQKLDGVELLAGMSNAYVIDASAEHNVAEDYAISLNNMTKNLVGVKIISRAYIKVDVAGEEKIIYSNNYDPTYDVVNGCGSRSVLQVATLAVDLLVNECGAPNTVYEGLGLGIKEIFASDNIPTDDAFKSFVFKYIYANRNLFPA